MSDYDYRPGGSLKLKGGVHDGGIVKKKKKSKSKSKDKDVPNKDSERRKELEAFMKDDEANAPSPSGSGSRHESPSVVSSDKKTDAEKRFEEVQRKRLAQRVAKLATTTHKDRVAEFNNKLEALSEHHDIPKVGPG